jgi:hypothetical protein
MISYHWLESTGCSGGRLSRLPRLLPKLFSAFCCSDGGDSCRCSLQAWLRLGSSDLPPSFASRSFVLWEDSASRWELFRVRFITQVCLIVGMYYSLFMRLYNNIALLIHLLLSFFAKVGASILLFFPLRQFRRLPVCSPVVLPFKLMSIVCMLTIVFDRFMCLSVLLWYSN